MRLRKPFTSSFCLPRYRRPANERRGLAVMIADAPEALIDGTIDLGELATEFLILGIDPYPRKVGSVFEAPMPGEDSARPFAALSALKKSPRSRKG